MAHSRPCACESSRAVHLRSGKLGTSGGGQARQDGRMVESAINKWPGDEAGPSLFRNTSRYCDCASRKYLATVRTKGFDESSGKTFPFRICSKLCGVP